jgi:hypothetical protein
MLTAIHFFLLGQFRGFRESSCHSSSASMAAPAPTGTTSADGLSFSPSDCDFFSSHASVSADAIRIRSSTAVMTDGVCKPECAGLVSEVIVSMASLDEKWDKR